MDEIIDALSSYQVTYQPNSTAAEHPRFSLYKAKSSSSSQEERRRKFLEDQKKKRFDYTSHARKLANDEYKNEVQEEHFSENGDMEVDEIKKPARSYKNQLMQSEWLVEVPPDLAEEWYLMLCPKGKRCLVVASRGRTKAYGRNGYYLNQFRSLIPGGSRSNANGPSSSYTLLDCVFNEVHKTFYILDVMCGNSHPMYETETEFRFFWLKNKLLEWPGLNEISKNNEFKFVGLPYYSCDAETIKKTVWSPLPFEPQLDGLMFYHKRAHYICGTSPLITWLKAYMLPEMLSIDVPSSLTADKPSNYTTMQEHVPKAFEMHSKRKEEEERNMQYEEE